MSSLQEALDKLTELIGQHDSVKAFHEIEETILQIDEFNPLIIKMKERQQEAVLYHKIEKDKAAKQAINEAKELNQQLDKEPLIWAYREKMQDASDLLQYVTKRLEERINEELGNGK
ncbi:YlbF family regulator [Streptococcus sp. zg-JUN1979]|uniref:YlbF family regulator n=1 Tax=Streptococcus sp. zg-JUN1979 TaxID=3391450 RepID=UPI0039A46D80